MEAYVDHDEYYRMNEYTFEIGAESPFDEENVMYIDMSIWRYWS